MKKFLLIAVAAMGLLFTACSKDEVAQPVGGEESVVTFTISTPELATRAHGDGLTATVLKYAVYNRVDGSKLFEGEPKTLTNKTAIVDIPFVNGMEYDILFWAEAPTSPYTVNFDAKTVAYTDATALVSNSEAYDAFYAYVNDIPEITGPVTKTVELKRPFAQLNIITNDATEAAQSGVTVKDVKVVVEGAYTDFDLANHKGLTKGTVTFGTAAKLGDETLAVNYLFPAAEKSLVDVEFTYTDVAGKLGTGEVKEFATVPIQRNYRTNIVGSLLTSEGTLNVVILPGFDGENEHSIVTVTPEDDVNALIRDPEVTTIELGAGEYEIELYNLAEKKTLTINGTDGTQIKFKDQQVRASQFDELVINNCEILRMATKSWGHLVFGSSDNAQGVYTISNCTFNGVGTQGIYINENTSGVTYNILNCTFNGNFGNEGAITIQTNPNVNHIVNVKGCTFNNIPDTSHKIFLASWDGQGSLYYGWTLNTDLKVTTTAELKSFIKLGLETINLADGTFAMTEVGNLQGKTLTFVGSANTIIDATNVDTRNQFVTGATLAFEGVTIKFSQTEYMGFANTVKSTYKDCTIINQPFLCSKNVVFDNCTFEQTSADKYNVWTWGAENVAFNNCTFNSAGKSVLIYHEAGINSVVTLNNCELNASAPVAGKAAIEIDSSFPNGGAGHYTVNINNTVANGFALGTVSCNSLWNEKKGDNCTVNVDGVEHGKTVVFEQAGLAAALNAGKTNIELMPATYDAGQFQVMNKTLSLKGIGDGAKIFISQNNDVAYTTFDMCNVTFENLTIETLGGIYKGFARMEGTYKNCTFVNNYFTLYGKHEFTGCTFNAPNDEHCMWTYGANKVIFNDCEFNYSDRCINVYTEMGVVDGVVTATDCEFVAANTSSKGAIEINSGSFANSIAVNLTDCTAPANGQIAFISGWDSVNGAKATVTIDGVVTNVPQLAR